MQVNDFNRTFAKKLRYYLDRDGILQKDFADQLGVSTSVVYYWLNAQRTPRIDKIDKMCELFGCTRQDLMTDAPQDDPVTDAEFNMIKKYRKLSKSSKETISELIDVLFERRQAVIPMTGLMAAHNDNTDSDQTAEMLTDAERIAKLHK